MHLEILTPEKRLYNGEVDIITLPGVLGSFQILNSHAPLVASLKKGTLSFTSKGKNEEIEIEDGVVEVHDNKIIVCLDNYMGTIHVTVDEKKST